MTSWDQWKRGKNKPSLQAIEDLGTVIGYRLKWEKIDANP